MTKAKLISVNEAARILGVSAPTVRAWTDNGKMAVHTRLGDGTRIFDSAVVEALAKARAIAPKRNGRHK